MEGILLKKCFPFMKYVYPKNVYSDSAVANTTFTILLFNSQESFHRSSGSKFEKL